MKTKNLKKFYLKYAKEFNGKEKTRKKLLKYTSCEKLIEHALAFEEMFPKFKMTIDELMIEGNRVFVRYTFKGIHSGVTEGIPATNKPIVTPFAVGYEIIDEKIVDFWAIGNEMELFEQLGLAKVKTKELL